MLDPSHPERNLPGRAANFDLWVCCAIAFLSTVVVLTEQATALRVIFGIPFVLFAPGYCLVCLLFPRSGGLDGLERIGVSFGLSMALVAPIALALDILPWGITTRSIVIGIAAVIVGFAWFATVRRNRVDLLDRFSIPLSVPPNPVPAVGPLNQVATSVLVVIVLLVLAFGLVHAIQNQLGTKPFTEFSMLTEGGSIRGFSRDLQVGETATVSLTIVNHEHSDVTYTISVTGDALSDSDPLTVLVKDGASWSGPVSFRVNEMAKSAVVRFELRRQEVDSEFAPAYRTLELIVSALPGTPVALVELLAPQNRTRSTAT